jgi:hypothetical protein
MPWEMGFYFYFSNLMVLNLKLLSQSVANGGGLTQKEKGGPVVVILLFERNDSHDIQLFKDANETTASKDEETFT